MNLNFKNFTYKDFITKGDDSYTGLIAEDVKNIFPNIVYDDGIIDCIPNIYIKFKLTNDDNKFYMNFDQNVDIDIDDINNGFIIYDKDNNRFMVKLVNIISNLKYEIIDPDNIIDFDIYIDQDMFCYGKCDYIPSIKYDKLSLLFGSVLKKNCLE
jgi:type IV secretory pathway VirB9-like protein